MKKNLTNEVEREPSRFKRNVVTGAVAGLGATLLAAAVLTLGSGSSKQSKIDEPREVGSIADACDGFFVFTNHIRDSFYNGLKEGYTQPEDPEYTPK